MTDQAMSPLRRRMIEDMTVGSFVAKTQCDYKRSSGVRLPSRSFHADPWSSEECRSI